MNKLFLLSTLLLLMIACNNSKEPQVVYDSSNPDSLTIENVLEDTTKVLVTGMPIYLDSTDILIHPIGWENIYLANKSRSLDITVSIDSRISKKNGTESDHSYSVYSNNKDYISGEMVNLIFENPESGEQRILTDKVMSIYHISYLKDLAKEINQHYLLYRVYDKDYNRDGKLNKEDMSAYYISTLEGTLFTKITKDYHYLDTYKLILKNGKFYFRTIEDINKDGNFNKKDIYHYYYVDLIKGDLTPIEYFPLKFIKSNN